MMRIVLAVPAVPMTMIGIHRFLAKSHNLPRLHGKSSYSSESRRPTGRSSTRHANTIRIRARKKFGIDRPMNPAKVAE